MGTAIGRRLTYTLLCAGSLACTLFFYLGNVPFNSVFWVSVLLLGGVTASFYGWLPLYFRSFFPPACGRPARVSASTLVGFLLPWPPYRPGP